MKPASKMPKQSKSLAACAERKKIEDLHKRIMTAIAQTGNPALKEDLETVLKSASDENILLHALNDKTSDVYPLELACGIASRSAQRPHQATILHTLQKNIFLLLDHGANPNLANNDINEMPIVSFFKLDLYNNETPPGFKFKFKDLIVKFIEKGADLTVLGVNDYTLIHMAAALDREVLTLICDQLPADWVNKESTHGETALITALRFNNTVSAFELIHKRNIDMDILSEDASHALSAAIFFQNPIIAQLMLAKGCSIDVHSNIIFRYPINGPTAPEQKKILLTLMKAGYFLPLSRHQAQHEALRTYFDAIDISKASFLFALEDIETKKIDYITSTEDLLNSTANISPEHNKRLHQSFQEIILNFEMDQDPHLANMKFMYEVFKGIYPLNEVLTLPRVKGKHKYTSGEHRTEKKNLWDIAVMLFDARKAPENIVLLTSLAELAKDVFHEQATVVLEISEMNGLIKKYNKNLMEAIGVMGSQDLSDRPFEYFVSKLTYQFAMLVVPMFLRKAKSAKDINDCHDGVIMLLSLATSFNLKYEDKTLDESMAITEQLIELYKKYDIKSTRILYFVTMMQIFLLRNYSEFDCHDAISDSMDVLIKHKSDFDLELLALQKAKTDKAVYGLMYNLDTGIFRALKILNSDTVNVLTYHSIITKMEYLADRYSFKQTKKECAVHKAHLMSRYKIFIESLNVLSFEHNGLFTLTLAKDELRITFNEEASKSKIRNNLISPALIFADANGYYIPLFQMELNEVQSRIDSLKTFKFDDFKRGERTRTQVVEAGPSKWYYATPGDYRSSSSTVSNPAISTDKPVIHTAKDKTDAFDKKCASIKDQLVKAHHVVPENVFLIHAPWLPKGREHKAWGVWDEITGENADRISKQLIDEHKVIAQNGKVVTKAAGESGLKSTMILNSQTHKKERTIKTKKLGNDGNLRIVSIPEDFVSEGENLKLYRFGITSFHK